VVQCPTGANEVTQFIFTFEFDFQFCDVEVFRVPKLTQEDGVHQLGNSLGDLPGVGLLRNFKEDDLGRRFGVDEVEQVAGTLIFELVFEEISEFLA
jgi:hypothetical protein